MKGLQQHIEFRFIESSGLGVLKLVEELFQVDVLSMNLNSQPVDDVAGLFGQLLVFLSKGLKIVLEHRVVIQLLPAHPFFLGGLQTTQQERSSFLTDWNSLGESQSHILNFHDEFELRMCSPRQTSKEHLR